MNPVVLKGSKVSPDMEVWVVQEVLSRNSCAPDINLRSSPWGPLKLNLFSSEFFMQEKTRGLRGKWYTCVHTRIHVHVLLLLSTRNGLYGSLNLQVCHMDVYPFTDKKKTSFKILRIWKQFHTCLHRGDINLVVGFALPDVYDKTGYSVYTR